MDKKNIWAWLLQRVSAVFLLFLLGTHFWVTHYSNLGEIIVFKTVQMRLATLTFIIVDFTLLAFVLFHALNGLRGVLLDFNVFARHERILTMILFVMGFFFLLYGGYGLYVFLGD